MAGRGRRVKKRPVLVLTLTRDQAEALSLTLVGRIDEVPSQRRDQLWRRQPIFGGDCTDLGMAALSAYKAAERRKLLTMMR